jgi:large subunit ribosomal protein L5
MAKDSKKDGAKDAKKKKGEKKAKGSKGAKESKGKGKGKKSAKKGGSKKGRFQMEPIKREEPPRLWQVFRQEIMPALKEQFGYKSSMEVPRLKKVVLNMGLGEAIQNPKLIESSVAELATISGQQPVVTRARKSVAHFKLREGMKIGVSVTLRRAKMYEFFDRMVNLAIPRVRDFKGVSPKSFDGRGNYTLGIREQIVFPEIDYDKIEKIMGLNVTVVTTAETDEEGFALLKRLGMPFRK